MATKKSSLEKYYISEKFDADRNISFNFKKANQKISGNFAHFLEAVEEFIRVSEKSKNDTRVWFHRDGAYRGSVDLAKAKVIVEKVSENKVENTKAIEFIEKENLVDKAAPKVKTPSVKKDNAKHVAFDTTNLPKSVFGLEKVYSQAIFDAILAERGAKRLATHKTKTRGEVSGSGKKPWAQKHTGNARAGSLRSPIFVGGGKVFGPTTERNYNLKINKKARRNALLSALTLLANDQAVLVKEYALDKISTRALLTEMAKDKLVNLNNVLLVSSNDTVFMSARNLPNVHVTKVTSLSVEALLAADVLVISENDVKVLEGLAK
ncbi:50S ribosomal protein L4 [Metamycoplasma neophronis]|uniref:Large ribosomal subunit protein uL4 n=1 Tax=Metamycoplasma neophronis TaxID=872983 RepID=A0ABY2YZK5_9BACT|nr:50S ribosomal protein L4 [Metamycoplasma neophronis]TPR53682.1 50S ribosomal protein L4 [Metamycoplasma neophronis]